VAAKSNNIPHSKKRAFLAAYRETGNVRAAAQAAKIDRCTHYDWLNKDEEYAAEFSQAQDDAVDTLETEARRRAVQGIQRMVLYQGVPVQVPLDPANPAGDKTPLIEHEYSDTLLIFLLKGARPEKYRDRQSVDLTSNGKGLSFTLQIGNPNVGNGD
jgi:hypothetical protein